MQEGKVASEDALQVAEKRREAKGKGERGNIYSTGCIERARREKKAFLSEQCKEIEENSRMGKTGNSSGTLEVPRGHSCEDGHYKEQKQQAPNRS